MCQLCGCIERDRRLSGILILSGLDQDRDIPGLPRVFFKLVVVVMFLLRVRADLLWRFVVGVVWFVPCQFKVTVCVVVCLVIYLWSWNGMLTGV